jgi:hypothetical protein
MEGTCRNSVFSLVYQCHGIVLVEYPLCRYGLGLDGRGRVGGIGNGNVGTLLRDFGYTSETLKM